MASRSKSRWATIPYFTLNYIHATYITLHYTTRRTNYTAPYNNTNIEST